MIIIVEGIDRVGKTTLCDKLSEEFGIPIHKYKGLIKYNKMNNTEESDKTLGLIQLLKETNSSIIFDRTYFTDFVYGTIERNYDLDIAIDNFNIIDNTISKLSNVFLIHILPTDIEESSRQHGKDLTRYSKEFYDLFRCSKIENKFRCNYNTMNEAISFIKGRTINEKCSNSIDN